MNAQVFEGHTHYVMQIVINPKDNNTFASASLDRTVKVWQLGSTAPNFTLEGMLITDSFHCFVLPSVHFIIWQCKFTIKLNPVFLGHDKGVNCVDYYYGGDKPYLISGADDRLVKIWDYQNKNCVQTLEGTIFIKLYYGSRTIRDYIHRGWVNFV